MSPSHHQLRTPRMLNWALMTGAACLSIYWCLRPALLNHHDDDASRPGKTVIRSRAREAATSIPTGASAEALPYGPDVFPGARDVPTAYGTIKVFEWGPENGEKVLLLHGIGTPCVALGDMARQFVSKGCRVMLFGKYIYICYVHVFFYSSFSFFLFFFWFLSPPFLAYSFG